MGKNRVRKQAKSQAPRGSRYTGSTVHVPSSDLPSPLGMESEDIKSLLRGHGNKRGDEEQKEKLQGEISMLRGRIQESWLATVSSSMTPFLLLLVVFYIIGEELGMFGVMLLIYASSSILNGITNIGNLFAPFQKDYKRLSNLEVIFEKRSTNMAKESVFAKYPLFLPQKALYLLIHAVALSLLLLKLEKLNLLPLRIFT